MTNFKSNLIFIGLIFICNIILLSCNKVDETNLTIFENLSANSSFNNDENKLILNLNGAENVYGLQYEVVDDSLNAISIESFYTIPTYNLYNDSCHTNSISNNISICVVTTSNITSPISNNGIITIEMSLVETNTAVVRNLKVVNRNLESHNVNINE